MAVAPEIAMSARPRTGRLVAVEGVSHGAIVAAARENLAAAPRAARGGISWWDASGLFEELAMGSDEAGPASARTLLLLYAADLAFRLRWEIRPLLARGRTVVAAPYVETAVAFGRAAGVPVEWIRDLFQFAPAADGVVTAPAPRKAPAGARGFVEFGCEHLVRGGRRGTAKQLAERARTLLK
jgi:hypothetical protein